MNDSVHTPDFVGPTHEKLIEAGWIDVAMMRQRLSDVLVDVLVEIEDDPIRWQHGGGASTGALVVTNIVRRRLRDGLRQHCVVAEDGDRFWQCSCSPTKWRPNDYMPEHRALAEQHSRDGEPNG